MKQIIILFASVTLTMFSLCQSQHFKKFDMNVLFSNDQVMILGDTTNWQPELLEGGAKYFAYKFSSFIKYPDFSASIKEDAQKAKIDYSSNKIARQYKTIITQTYNSKGINFAGYYCFVYWGCGSPCKQSALVDSRDGKVYDGPSSGLGYEFQKDSRMLIVNPPDSTGWFLDVPYGIPEVHIWNEQTKSFEKR